MEVQVKPVQLGTFFINIAISFIIKCFEYFFHNGIIFLYVVFDMRQSF